MLPNSFYQLMVSWPDIVFCFFFNSKFLKIIKFFFKFRWQQSQRGWSVSFDPTVLCCDLLARYLWKIMRLWANILWLYCSCTVLLFWFVSSLSLLTDKTIKLWKISERDKRPEGYNLKEEDGRYKDPNTITSLRVSPWIEQNPRLILGYEIT